MVICVIALVVFGILGIFSASHRQIAREAFDCVFRKMTLRPCNTGLDKRLKVITSMKVMKYNQNAGKFVHKNFEAISLFFTILMVASLAYSAYSVYNYVAYGNCNGKNSTEGCLLNPETWTSGPFDFLFPKNADNIKLVSSEGTPSIGDISAKVKIVEVGCFSCPYTRAAEPIVKELLQKYDGKIYFSFKYLPIPSHSYSTQAAIAAECAREQGKFWEYKDILFEKQSECGQLENLDLLNQHYKIFAGQLGLDQDKFNACLDSSKYASFVEKQKSESIAAGIYATPTFFINGKVVVAPKSKEELFNIIDTELNG